MGRGVEVRRKTHNQVHIASSINIRVRKSGNLFQTNYEYKLQPGSSTKRSVIDGLPKVVSYNMLGGQL